ncbi:unnamed protein product [Kuraishia capsulata CBS 1993]|uniref:RRM domain-containing protein n=1 Tax=Kuraishia capsulata CBS 1993 TaxID=1382522 RepID=W6MM56_9ASCO|nr:uncharacterized protein KUCA_T00003608001 [Kuraishia capsulata CBS 1993]CDK27629.1 unnamed protein product [Kuraishia capsulata CBS 1993]
MSEEMEVDNYERQRSRSPVRDSRRDRSRSPARGPPRRRLEDRIGERGGRGFRGGDRGFRGGRGGRGGDFRDRGRFDRRGPPSRDFAPRASEPRNHENTVFVGNLPFSCEWYQLKDHFKEIGEVVRADIIVRGGRSRGMGTVEFQDYQTAQDAIARYDHTTFLEREIFVRMDQPPPEEAARPAREERVREREPRDAPKGFEIYVGNLAYRTTWQDLKDVFRDAGSIVRADVGLDRNGRSRGYGLVYFETKEDADRAIEMFNDYELEGRRLEVRHPRSRQEPEDRNSDFNRGVSGDGEPSAEIYVDNLPWATTNEDLVDLFANIGSVDKAEVQYNDFGKASGRAVIRFQDEESAASAIAKLDNYEYGRRNLKITYARRPESSAPAQTESVAEAAPEAAETTEAAPTEDDIELEA